jgi:hypothetical protein
VLIERTLSVVGRSSSRLACEDCESFDVERAMLQRATIHERFG